MPFYQSLKYSSVNVVNVVHVIGGYEAHFSRLIERTFNLLERLRRMRKGQTLQPQLDVKIS